MSASDGQLYPFGYGDEELRRLGVQHRVWQEENLRRLSRAGFGQGNTLVDLGCGPGLTTIDLARRVGPTGRIIAVDRDGERTIPRLREAVDVAGLKNVETRVADLDQFDLPSESVDGVYGRWVLMYLPEREARALARYPLQATPANARGKGSPGRGNPGCLHGRMGGAVSGRIGCLLLLPGVGNHRSAAGRIATTPATSQRPLHSLEQPGPGTPEERIRWLGNCVEERQKGNTPPMRSR